MTEGNISMNENYKTLIGENVARVRGNIAAAAERAGRNPLDVTLVAVTKTRTPLEIAAAVEAGCVDLGENRVQEFLEKKDEIQELVEKNEKNEKKLNIKWHLIGHLQRNKVKYIAESINLIHSVDSFRLAEEIEARANAAGRQMDVLLQLNTAGEAQKAGVSFAEAEELTLEIAESFPHIHLCGLMAVVPAVENSEEVRGYFRKTRALFDSLKEKYGEDKLPYFKSLSMGMTQDYEVAVEEGATMVRVGSGIFGPRV